MSRTKKGQTTYHFEFQNIENSFENDIQLLNHVAVKHLQLFLVVEVYRYFLTRLRMFRFHYLRIVFLGQKQLCSIKGLKENLIFSQFIQIQNKSTEFTRTPPMTFSHCFSNLNRSTRMSIGGTNLTSYSKTPVPGSACKRRQLEVT